MILVSDLIIGILDVHLCSNYSLLLLSTVFRIDQPFGRKDKTLILIGCLLVEDL